MRTFLLTLALLTSVPALSCQGEAQFIGNITHIVDNGQSCRLFVDISYFNPSMVCPLSQSELFYEGILVSSKSCPYDLGEAVSGVIARLNGELVFD